MGNAGASSSCSEQFSAYSTAQNVADFVVREHGYTFEGKFALVTGANTGIGKETARVLAANGAHVVMGCRSLERGDAAMRDIKQRHPMADIQCIQLDLSCMKSIQRCAKDYCAMKVPLHLLINNAGIFSMDFEISAYGFEKQWAINHLG